MVRGPTLIVIDGPMGAGKTTTSNLLHSKLIHSALVPLDRIKHFISGVKPDDVEHLQLASEIGAVITKEYLKRGRIVIVEKPFTKEEYLKGFLKMVNPKKVPVLIYQLNAPLDIRIKRIKGRELVDKDSRRPTMEKIHRNHHQFTNFGYRGAKMFDSSKLSPLQIVNRILKDISLIK
jgi:cytidylate kinase